MSDTQQPWGWAYRDVNDADTPINWFITRNLGWLQRKNVGGTYVITPLYTAPPPEPDPAPVKESVTVPRRRTLREDAAIRVMATIVDWKDLKAEWEGPAVQAVKAADALVKALEETHD
jgi:hypothetical protein